MERNWNFLQWRVPHNDLALDLVRIFLGIALFIRGALFMSNQSILIDFVRQQGMDWLLPMIGIHFVTLAHLYGGFVLVFGLLTRMAAFIQIPVLAGAVILSFAEGLFFQGQSLELSVLVLFLLGVIFVFGPGHLSLDYYFFFRKAQPDDAVAPAELARLRLQREQEREARNQRIQEERLAPSAFEQPHVEEGDFAVLETSPTTATIKEPEVLIAPADQKTDAVPLFKYALVFAFAFAMAITMIFMQDIPIMFSFEEMVGVGGVLLFIFGMFFLLYKTAFAESK